MMSIAQVRSAGSAGNYYTDKDNYYVLGSMGERWAGRGAEQLGLQGSVDKDVFTRLLEGKLPDGADLSRMQDGSNKHRPGYDLTFSAPKSVSVMAMLGGDKRLIDAHNQAVDFAVRQVEALASTRVMTDGQSETVLTGNLVMALFNHDTSRDQEPQLHTHAVVANVTQHNGEWKTLSSDKVGKRPSAVKRNAVRMKLSVKWQRTNLTCRTAKQSRLSGILPGWSVTGLPYLNGKPRCRRVYCVNHNGCGKRSGRLPGKICCRSDCSRWSGIWFVTCRKRKPWAETDTGR
ncbi:MobF family relaxase [Escherichia coli]|uniref:MobF family relaxase n=1 Tax=Escherichia coli TaxID=562 RepID=UPI001FF6C57C|nr:MobF family relaxase [Escherichia coli]MCK3184606.1 conjugative relaxase [Escherichia coli]MDZ8444097.1 MobF family relaxase [Escherichia coli]MDZ8830523.1 MobF family relaxase [Escherichia coli]MEA0459900.1 MobF family relaxase [Escherichia coli]MEA0523502.1 MobF family relaxase [Escherichia coli]